MAVLAVTLTGCSAGLVTRPTPDASGVAPKGSATSTKGSVAGAEGGQAGAASKLPGLPTAEKARTALDGLKVAAQGSISGYSRAKFPQWSSQGDSCDTRELVLQRDGTDVQRDDECRPVSGKWLSVYDNKTFTATADLGIDHTVPLANAWRSGADTWTQDEREAFANDLTHPQLLTASTATTRSKGDRSPDEWQPPLQSYWCAYARSWTIVKATYKLTVTQDEKAMLTKMLDTCTP
ncbi:HNH endonuclease family protein [Streptomyces sp. LBL]|uniref:HNH endonuclease family protein n=1 Tax=Streptomyces sp. LBL TaxID=2940562 RepID=UPI0024769455|nr:HNH endonuclease family protein [Streptomyces sp. LBL]